MLKIENVRILLVDNAPDRKERIGVLTASGLRVFPALSLQQARERCAPGKYDLIAVNSAGDAEAAMELCDQILAKDPRQRVLLMTPSKTGISGRDYAISDEPHALLAKVKMMLGLEDKSAAMPTAA